MGLVEEIIEGKVRAVAQMITLVERQDARGVDSLKQLYSKCGRAHIIGVTGPPGAGKSCLVAALTRQFRQKNLSVGILAVDPSSPFTGGAILGDRARMEEFNCDPQVFIRSLATRGSVGGLSEAVNGAVDIFDASGKDVIIIETVGVGQNEIDIVNVAHTVILVLVPGYGDGLQAMKAGILEVGDILVVNKADLPGADTLVSELRSLPGKIAAEDLLDTPEGFWSNWQVPVSRAVALKDEGSRKLAGLIGMHFHYLKAGGQLLERVRTRRVNQFLDVLSKRIRTEFALLYRTDSAVQQWIRKIETLRMDPYQASEQVIDFMKKASDNILKERKTPTEPV
jgi:LAO/AO transport system kinase